MAMQGGEVEQSTTVSPTATAPMGGGLEDIGALHICCGHCAALALVHSGGEWRG